MYRPKLNPVAVMGAVMAALGGWNTPVKGQKVMERSDPRQGEFACKPNTLSQKGRRKRARWVGK